MKKPRRLDWARLLRLLAGFLKNNPKSKMDKLRWGILSTARIGTEKVIPAMQQGAHGVVAAIASRNLENAQAAAARLGRNGSV